MNYREREREGKIIVPFSLGATDRVTPEAGLPRIRRTSELGSRKMTTIDSIRESSILGHSGRSARVKAARKRRRMRGMQWARREVVRAPRRLHRSPPLVHIVFSPSRPSDPRLPLPFSSSEFRLVPPVLSSSYFILRACYLYVYWFLPNKS